MHARARIVSCTRRRIRYFLAAPERKRSQHRTFLTLWSPAGTLRCRASGAACLEVPSVCRCSAIQPPAGGHLFRRIGITRIAHTSPTMLRSDSREHLFVPGTMSEEQLRCMALATLMPHAQPKFGVSSRVAIANDHEPAIRDRIVWLFRQRTDVYKI